jgi:hypothetical protein
LSVVPSAAPVTASRCAVSAKGYDVADKPPPAGTDQRAFKSRRAAPAILAMTPSNTFRFRSSLLKP